MAPVSRQQRLARVAAFFQDDNGKAAHREEAQGDVVLDLDRDRNDTDSVRGKPHLPIAELPRQGFAEKAALHAPENVRDTLRRVIDVAMTAPGRCAFAIASKAAFGNLNLGHGVDFQRADKGGDWDDGYMTTRLRGVRTQDEAFQEAVHEWSVRTEGSRWPSGHEAEGLSKDGFTALVDPNGQCLRCAVYIHALRAAPLTWDRVGSLHGTALQLCWALRRHRAAVVVRSIAGTVHVIVPDGGRVTAFRCEL